jgi:hypothetical protein
MAGEIDAGYENRQVLDRLEASLILHMGVECRCRDRGALIGVRPLVCHTPDPEAVVDWNVIGEIDYRLLCRAAFRVRPSLIQVEGAHYLEWITGERLEEVSYLKQCSQSDHGG